MKKILLTIVLILGIFVNYLFAQSKNELQEFYDEGQYFFNRGDYKDALHFYLKLVKYDSLNSNFNFKVGECYLNIPDKEHLAIPYFFIAKRKTVPKKTYKKNSIDERAAPLHALFYLGNAYRMDNQLDKALKCYSKFLDSPYFWDNYNYGVVEREIKSCERAKIIQDAPLDFEKTNLGEAINSRFSEDMPVISGDGNSFVFIRKLQFYDAVFYSTRDENGAWRKAVNINPQILSDGEYYPSGLSFDGEKLLLVKYDELNADIYISQLDGETWTVAKQISKKINSLANEVHASFSRNGEIIYVSSDKMGGKGGFDIYASRLSGDMEWGKPKNLGGGINTEFDEKNAVEGCTSDILFFSSVGHYNMGGYDIFYSRKDGKRWGTPVNIGYPINDTRNNLYYYPTGKCREGFYSMMDTNGYGGKDIYLIQIKTESVLSFESKEAE